MTIESRTKREAELESIRRGSIRSLYHLASKYVAGKDVLEIRYSNEDGATILRDAGAKHTTTVLGNGVGRLPFREGSFDLAIAFELPGTEGDDLTVAELGRAIRANGLAVVSTRNRLRDHSLCKGLLMPTHTGGYLPDEFEDLVKKTFPTMKLSGQRPRPRFRVSPFADPAQLSLTARLSWRTMEKLPASLKYPATRLLLNRTFYPGEYDYVFDAEEIADCHSMVAIYEEI